MGKRTQLAADAAAAMVARFLDMLPARLERIRAALEAAGFTPAMAEVVWKPLNEIELTGEDAAKMRKLLDALESLDDVQAVYTSAVFDEEEP